MRPVLISIVGRKGSGRSQIIEKLIADLKQKDLQVGLIKHLAKSGFEIDQPGKDTDRYRKAGAQTVILSGEKQLAIFCDLDREVPLEKLLLMFAGYDVVLLEGYFQPELAKIEVHRSELGNPLTQEMGNVLAVVSDTQTSCPITHFGHDERAGLASFVEEWVSR